MVASNRSLVTTLVSVVALGAMFPAAFVDAATAPSGADMVLDSDFEGGTLSGWNVSGNSPTVQSDIVRRGSRAMKSVLDKHNSNINYRTEVSMGTNRFIEPGADYWYGFSIYLPSDYVSDPVWEIVAQWHNNPDTSAGESSSLNPPLSLSTTKGVWRLSTIWDDERVTEKSAYDGGYTHDLGGYQTARWTDWVFHVRWSPDANGVLQVWKDGNLVVDKKGAIGFNDASAPYFKMGIYKGWKDPTQTGVITRRTLYHDAFKMVGPGGQYSDVAPGGAAKESVPPPEPPSEIVIQ